MQRPPHRPEALPMLGQCRIHVAPEQAAEQARVFLTYLVGDGLDRRNDGLDHLHAADPDFFRDMNRTAGGGVAHDTLPSVRPTPAPSWLETALAVLKQPLLLIPPIIPPVPRKKPPIASSGEGGSSDW